jgi:YecR-like lipoprotein
MNLRILMIFVLSMAGCATPKTLIPIGGSRADGLINFAYEVGILESPVVDYAAAQVSAEKSCKAWGYSSARPLGGSQSNCIKPTGDGGCLETRVTVPYQCVTGNSVQ